MPSHQISLFFHLVAFMGLATVVVGTWIIEAAMAKADWAGRAAIARVARPIGILAPISSLLLIATGFSNLITIGIEPGKIFSTYGLGWVAYKLVFVVIATVLGATFNPKFAKQRMGIIMEALSGKAGADLDARYQKLVTNARNLAVVLTLLFFTILALAVFRPA